MGRLLLAAGVLAALTVTQRDAPRLDLPAYPLPRPAPVVREVYEFAGAHPEVVRFVPCFCGCEASGHTSAESCFVRARRANGDVAAWNEHGMTCGMCLAVVERAMTMHRNKASVREIRASVEQSYAALTSSRTSTPTPP